MKKAMVVYFTTSGNTEMLAKSLVEGLEAKGVEATLKNVSEANAEEVNDYDLLAFGCPAQGDEELDDTEFSPYFAEVLPLLAGKKVALFGCYGWGGGAYMENWAKTVTDAKATLVADGLTVLETPDDDALAQAKSLGEKLAQA